MAKFRTGDIFTFQLPSDEWMCGRLMFDVKRQAIRPKLLKSDSPLVAFNGSLLIEVYQAVSQTPVIDQTQVLIPGMFVDSASLESDKWLIVGHQEVDPMRVEFPEGLISKGRHSHFRRGEISLPINLSFREVRHMRVYNTVKASGTLGEICLYHLGRADEINNPNLKNVELRSLKNSDFRFSEHRSKIYQLLGEEPTQSYYEMSTRLGHDIHRFYPTKKHPSAVDDPILGNEGIIILCPYCMGLINENTKLCLHCGEDTTRDAPLEMELEEYYNAERKLCSWCGKLKLKKANPCPFCGKQEGKW